MTCGRHSFRQPELLREALTIPEPNRTEADNQRLEFLGDAVLQLLVSEHLYARHPQVDEGPLTAMRAQLVSGKALRARAERIPGLIEALKRHNSRFAWPEKALADAVEAYFGALWLDGGRAAAQEALALLYDEADFLTVAQTPIAVQNPKGALMEHAQHAKLPLPVYRVIEASGPLHAPNFRCEVAYAGHTGEGIGKTRRAAEAEAARALLVTLRQAPPPYPHA